MNLTTQRYKTDTTFSTCWPSQIRSGEITAVYTLQPTQPTSRSRTHHTHTSLLRLDAGKGARRGEISRTSPKCRGQPPPPGALGSKGGPTTRVSHPLARQSAQPRKERETSRSLQTQNRTFIYTKQAFAHSHT